MEIEICRLVFTQDTKGNSFWDAREQVLGQDNVIFKGPVYVDQYWKTANNMLSGLKRDFGFGDPFEEKRHSDEQKKAANMYVVAQLASLGWEPTTFDHRGLVTSLKRVKPKSKDAYNQQTTSEKIHSNPSNEETKIVIACENCGQKLRIPLRRKNLHIACPKCHHEFNYEYVEGDPVDD
jgi:hypothetical protein